MKKHDFFLATYFIILCLASSTRAFSADNNRYNVLFIAIDDLRPELGSYGFDKAQSPSLDRFARESIQFNRHYVQVPTCGASRYSLLTGQSPYHSEALQNHVFNYGKSALKREMQKGAQTLPELFNRSGYETICIGKISHSPDGLRYNRGRKLVQNDPHNLPHAWSIIDTPKGHWPGGFDSMLAYANGKYRMDQHKTMDLMEFVAEKDDELPDALLAQNAIKHLKRLSKSKKRFFMGLGFYKPHLPFVATKKDWDAFKNITLDLPKKDRIQSPYWHHSGEFYKYNMPFPKTRPLSDEAILQCKKAYYACVRYVDRQVGKVIQAVKELKLEEDTLIVIWGDHGWQLGEYQSWGKHTPFELANRSVLMIRLPGKEPKGRQTNALAASLDIYPTLVDLCNPSFSQTHKPLHGKSLLPLLTGKSTTIRQTVNSYWGKAISVRSDRYRLIMHRKTGAVELYDLSQELDQMQNCAELHPEIVKQLKKGLPI